MRYRNPILKGFHPDPSICRVGEDFYLVTSSMEYFPGVPVYHSKDLVNWRQIGNCITRTEQVSLAGMDNSSGVWAPTIRYHEGVFYVTIPVCDRGNLIVSTTDISGEWSDPVWVPMGGIDPSLLFDGDKVYYCTNEAKMSGREAISLAEINIQTGELLGESKEIWYGTGEGYLEAPHIYHIGDWYYLLTAEGGTFYGHMITVARSKEIWGSYESCPENPILTNRNDTSKEIQCAGHGDLVEDADGHWWMIHLGIRLARRTMSNLGRETFLTPIYWKDGWPVVGTSDKDTDYYRKNARLINDVPLAGKQQESKGVSYDFVSEKWEPQWLFLRQPELSCYERGNGKAVLYTSAEKFENLGNPTFVALRPLDFEYCLETEMDFSPEEGEEAGIVLYLQSDFYYRFCKRRKNGKNYLVVHKKAEDFEQIAYEQEIEDGSLHLGVKSDKLYHSFYIRKQNGEECFLCKASTRFLSCDVAGRCFTGSVVGIYAMKEGNDNQKGTGANFRYVSMKPLV